MKRKTTQGLTIPAGHIAGGERRQASSSEHAIAFRDGKALGC